MSLQSWEFTKIWGSKLHYCKGSALLNHNAFWEFGCRNPFLFFLPEKKANRNISGPWASHNGAVWPNTLHTPPQARTKASPTLLPGLWHPQGSPGTCSKIVKCSSMVILYLVSDFLNSPACFVLYSPIFGVPMGIFSIEGDHQNCFLWGLIFNLLGS